MRDLDSISAMNDAFVRAAHRDALADKNPAKAERIRAANPDLFAGLNSSEDNDTPAELFATSSALFEAEERAHPFSIAAVLGSKFDNE